MKHNSLYIGTAVPNRVFSEWGKYSDVVTKSFNCFTPENEMKPDALLDGVGSRASLPESYTHAKVRFLSCEPIIKTAISTGAKVRLHTLVWHSQTPDWFFTEDYTEGGALVGRDVMLCRMESYIHDVLSYFIDNYPDLIYAVDVVNEAFDRDAGDDSGVRRKNNKWYATVGDDYYYQALRFAKKYSDGKIGLFYNDYACMYKPDMILSNLKKARDEGLVDGIGLQSHLTVGENLGLYFDAMKKFADAGYELQVTELDIGIKEKSKENLRLQAEYYGKLADGIASLKASGTNITALTVWGISDELSWRHGEYPLLFDENLLPKPAYFEFFPKLCGI
ncbi:MAG: endo-1,4-beta-xylanase [Firmicutes bacterium]|nr:endo-1,4-beta-xylanase [Bacillota bacterium]